ncbi:MAG: hypothetical protein IT556_06945 [Acetobacteraceae bacterium]|nr:hypothetical protein [Acetobacteraceae bacterium]
MELPAFLASLSAAAPPAGLGAPLVALWHDARGDWQAAHQAVQAHEGEPQSDWVHAYLHRKEGDNANAGYWYRRAGRAPGSGPLAAEWQAIAAAMLGAAANG